MSQEEHLKQFASKLWLTDYLHGYRTPEDLWTFGIEDSLAVLNHVELRGRVLDIGPGGGLPGIVLAIVLRDVQFTLVDSSQKSCKFLTEITSALGLTNVQIFHERIEDFGKVIVRSTTLPLAGCGETEFWQNTWLHLSWHRKAGCCWRKVWCWPYMSGRWAVILFWP